MNILAIESSCDETACAIVADGVNELSSVVASSAELHEKTGGVVPEVAARKQVESIVPVIQEAILSSGLDAPKEVDAVAVAHGPGLIGSLIVGVEAAKALSLAWNKPLIPVNHLIGHIYGNFIENSDIEELEFPAVVLIVSGGHTDLVLMKDHGNFAYLGGTVDDAAGEAFDKVARLLGLAKYLGGKELSETAATCTNNTLAGALPRPMISHDNYDFSFSGLKTAVRNLVEKEEHDISTVACEFETAVADVLVTKTLRAAKDYEAKAILLGGGVSANTHLRSRMGLQAKENNKAFFVPPLKYCGDAASYIASAAFFSGTEAPIKDVLPKPSLGILD